MEVGLTARRCHFDPVFFFVVKGEVFKITDGEVGVQLPHHATQQVQIESRGNAFCVVIGGLEWAPCLFQDQRLSISSHYRRASCWPGSRTFVAVSGIILPMVDPGK